jgi:tetratricopeptide (TPR) repeat protein
LENSSQAIPDFNQAIELDPRSEEAFYFRGVAHALAGNYDRALDDLNRTIRINPHNADAFMVRAGILSEQGAMEKSLEDIIQAINLLERQGESQRATEIRELLGY